MLLGIFISEPTFPRVRLFKEAPSFLGEEVAIKLEPVTSQNAQLVFEHRLYRILKGGVGIPSVSYYGVEGAFNVMVMELLGPSLEDLFGYCYNKFSLKTVCMLAQDMISRLEYLHSKNYIHRDVKPDNFAIGLGKKANILHIIDLGLSKRYRHPTTRMHIPYVFIFIFILHSFIDIERTKHSQEHLDMHPWVIILEQNKVDGMTWNP